MSIETNDRLTLTIKKPDGTIIKTISDVPISEVTPPAGPGPTPTPTPSKPTAIITFNPPIPRIGEMVYLDGSQSTASKPEGSIVEYQWFNPFDTTFLISTSPDKKTASFKFPNKQCIDISLKIRDSDNLEATKTVTIITNDKPTTTEPDPIPTDPIPTPIPGESIVICSVGDSKAGSTFKKIATNIMKEKPNLFRFLGDSSYLDNDGNVWNAVIDSVPGLKQITQMLKGNHEDKEEDADVTGKHHEAWFKPVYDLVANKWLSTKIIGNVYCIAGNSQDTDYQYIDRFPISWFKEKLAEATRLRAEGKIDWIIAGWHKPQYTLITNHAPEFRARDNYGPLMDEAGVDICEAGHNHHKELWKRIKYGGVNKPPILVHKTLSDGTWDFSEGTGVSYMINGCGGTGLNDVDEDWTKNPNVAYYDASKYGYTKYTITGKKMRIEFKDADMNVLKTINITREGSGTSPVPPIEEARAVLEMPNTVEPRQTNVVADASKSQADDVIIEETSSEGLQLRDAGKWKKVFDIPDKNNFSIGLKATAIKGSKRSVTQRSIQVSSSGPGPQPTPTLDGMVLIHNSDLVLSQEHTVAKSQFSKVDPQIDMTGGGEGDKNLYIKKGPNGKNMMVFGGDRTRWNVYLHKDYRKATDWDKIPIDYANQMYEIQWKPLNNKCKNLSFSFRTIHDPLSDGKEGFGKYGCHWGIMDGPECGIKVEFYHNDQAKGYDFKLPRAIKVGETVTTRMFIWSDPTGKREVTQAGFIQYQDDPTWHFVFKFTYTKDNWGSAPSGGSSIDRAEYTGGPYMKPGIRIWCRSNGGGQFEIYNFNLYKIVDVSKLGI